MKKIFGLSMILYILFGCEELSTTKIEYIVENGTDHNIELNFFKTVNVDGVEFVFSERLSGKGEFFSKSDDIVFNGNESPNGIFESDSVVVIFNNERQEVHFGFDPEENNVFNVSDYRREQEGRSRILLTEQNFNNSVPCNGPCK